MYFIIVILLCVVFLSNLMVGVFSNSQLYILSGLGILPIMLSVYFTKRLFSYFVFALALTFAAAMYFLGAEGYLAFLLSLCLTAVFLITTLNKKRYTKEEATSSRQIERQKKAIEDRKKMSHELRGRISKLNQQSREIEDLYEVTKRMSAFLKFEDIFRILCSELKNNFEFDDCRLIHFNCVKGEVHLEDVYDIPIEARIKDAKSYDHKIVDAIYNNKTPLFLAKAQEAAEQNEIMLPLKIESLVAVPIYIDERIGSVVVAENIHPESFEKFSIIIGQFGLEMKKVVLYELVEKLAITDGLTGLLLRRHFLGSFKKELERLLANKLPISVLMLDIDHFKKFNDLYGHLIGDGVLIKISDIIRNNTREIDLICRYGGEEFCIALPEINKRGAYAVAERIRKQVERENFMAEGQFTKASVSIGVAASPEDSSLALDLIDKADQALYKAKNSGRNNTYSFK